MDCEKIEREEIVDRYLLGELSDEEQKLFEEHYFGCDRCFQELRETEMMMCGLEILDREGALVFEEGMEKRRFKWPAWLTWRPSPVVATAMALLIVVLVYPAWRGLVVLPELNSALREVRRPHFNLQSYSLQQAPRGEAQRISLPKGQERTFILYFNILEKRVANPKYRAEITDQWGEVVWTGEDLRGTGEYEIFSILCHSSFFEEGIYTLEVYEFDPENNEITNQFPFHFEIVNQ